MRARVRGGFFRGKLLRLARVLGRVIQIDGGPDEAAPIPCMVRVLDGKILELARVLLGKGEQVPGRALVHLCVARIQLAQDPSRLAGAVAR